MQWVLSGGMIMTTMSALLLLNHHGRSLMNQRTRNVHVVPVLVHTFSSLLFASSARAFSATSSSQKIGTAASFLKDPSLLDWETSSACSSENLFPVTDPASPDTGTILANVPSMDARQAIQNAHETLPAWRDDTTAAVRANLLQQWSLLMTKHADDLAIIMTLESGKPLAESKGEVNYAKSFLDYYAAEATRPTGAGGGFVTPSGFATASGSPRGQMLAMSRAVGVTAMITPWNFPMAMITRKVGPALAAGCTAIVKPSDLTPLSAMALKNLADRAGIPEHVFQVV
jgi:succinate-semialdehyde dehydrogenase/glutarate-semialdehyde dehydrogenase